MSNTFRFSDDVEQTKLRVTKFPTFDSSTILNPNHWQQSMFASSSVVRATALASGWFSAVYTVLHQSKGAAFASVGICHARTLKKMGLVRFWLAEPLLKLNHPAEAFGIAVTFKLLQCSRER
ncbi:MAG: hypothetical protein AAF402_03375 [Pseudomonadota bacterium]